MDSGELDFHDYLQNLFQGVSKAISLARKLQTNLFKQLAYLLEFLQQRQWYRKLCLFFKNLFFKRKKSLKHLFELIPILLEVYMTN